jgi:hypothetical protein
MFFTESSIRLVQEILLGTREAVRTNILLLIIIFSIILICTLLVKVLIGLLLSLLVEGASLRLILGHLRHP